MMKNLTHYFTSPKEDETTTKSSPTLLEKSSNNDTPIQNADAKKRKISLSKSKTKKNEITVRISKTENKEENKNIIKDNSNIKINKRKISNEICEENIAYSKKIKICKSKSSTLKLVKSKSPIETSRDKQDKRRKQINCTEVIINVESNSSSCDESLANTKRSKSKKNIFPESDDDTTQSLEIVSKYSVDDSSQTSDTSKNVIENLSSAVKNLNGARNSLLGYFNKVDKETALKEKKNEIIKVEAQVHIPPAEKDKSLRCSLNRLPTKLKKPKEKLVNDYDSIEVISSEVISEEDRSVSVQMSSKTLCNDFIVSDVKRHINIEKVQPANIASIFIPKKTDKSNVKNTTNNSSNNENVSISEEETLKKEKLTADTQTKQKKSLKIKKSKKTEQNCESIHNSSIKNCDVSPEELDSKKAKKVKKNKQKIYSKSKLIKTNSNQNGLNRDISSQNLQEKENLLKTEKLEEKPEGTCVTVIQTSIHKTPEKINVQESDVDSTSKTRTPKQKSHTINGYFTPKINNDSCENKDSAETVHKHKKSPSAWVMKVRFSATKPRIGSGSDEEFEDSNQEENQKKGSQEFDSGVEIEVVETEQIKTCCPKDEPENEIVIVVDEEDSSNSCEADSTKRKGLPRSARSLKYEEASEPTKPPVKMWPFFQKGGSKHVKEPPVDQEKLKAKLMFLESGVPEVLKKKVEIEKSESVVGVPAPFPTVTHVRQIDVNSTKEMPSRFHLPRQQGLSPAPSVPAWSSLLSTGDLDEVEIPIFQRPENVKTCLDKMKDEEPKTEVKSLYKCLKEYKKKAESDIWTEVYKPKKSADIVGNSENIKKLKTWLETFKNRRRREGSVSSGDEFINEDSDGESCSINNLAVVSGPSGCGKTCAVYAIAAELDCKVLEINASCNRSGKRILAEFSESTQSHQVERSQPLNGMFNNQSSRKPKKKKKFKKTDEAKSEKTSLILVEDADLLYADADEGYMQAVSSLAATAKRPIILVTNQTRNPHLDRFQSNRPLYLTFSKPKSSKLELWLRLVGLVEGVEIAADQAKHLVAWSGCDIRRALLQLQLMVHSNNSELKEKLTHSELWWQWPLYRGLQYELPTLLEAEEPPQYPKMAKVQLLRELEAISHTTSRLAYLDVFSARCSDQFQMVCKEEDPCSTSWAAQCSDSTAQTQCLQDPVQVTGTHLADWLAETVAREGSNLATADRPVGQTAQEARWLSILRQSEQMFLSGVSSTMLSNHNAVACEYLPALREIGRAEQVRLTNYSRRANRFFNYLQGLGIHASKSYRDFMCDAFS